MKYPEAFDVPYSWFPIAGCVIDFTRPQVGLYTALNCESDPLLYWLSPSASTAAKPPLMSRLDVASCWHVVEVPAPPL